MSFETRLEEPRVGYEEVEEERDQLRAAHAGLVKERGS